LTRRLSGTDVSILYVVWTSEDQVTSISEGLITTVVTDLADMLNAKIAAGGTLNITVFNIFSFATPTVTDLSEMTTSTREMTTSTGTELTTSIGTQTTTSIGTEMTTSAGTQMITPAGTEMTTSTGTEMTTSIESFFIGFFFKNEIKKNSFQTKNYKKTIL